MFRFLIRRSVGGLVTLLIIAAVTFFLFHAVPADPARLACGRVCPPGVLEQARHNLGLDQPLLVQFTSWLAGLVAGRDYPTLGHCPAPCLGFSFVNQEPVLETILDRLPVTLSLAAGASVVYLCLGVGAGVVAALHRGRPLDRIVSAASLIGSSLQIYFVGTLAMYFLVYQWQLLGRPRYVPLTSDPLGWAEGLLLPWLVLALVLTANYTRITRATMVEQLAEDYVRTARAKGMSRSGVILRFALRGTLSPVVTLLGVDVGVIIGGAIITETTFGLQGVSRLAVNAVTDSDLPMLMATVLLAAAAVVVCNVVVDAAHALIDPRVRLT